MSRRDSFIIEPKTVIIKNPAINYGISSKPLRVWLGEVTSFEPRVRFGKHLPVPWQKEYECRATDEVMALQLLAKQAYRDGYAIGGVQHVHLKET